jgi:hypothetical protein
MDDVPHVGGHRSVGNQSPLDQRRLDSPAHSQLFGDVAGQSRLLDGDVSGGQLLALAARQRGIGLEHLEALTEGGRHRNAPDEGAAALPTVHLAVALEALQREAEGSSGDAE